MLYSSNCGYIVLLASIMAARVPRIPASLRPTSYNRKSGTNPGCLFLALPPPMAKRTAGFPPRPSPDFLYAGLIYGQVCGFPQ